MDVMIRKGELETRKRLYSQRFHKKIAIPRDRRTGTESPVCPHQGPNHRTAGTFAAGANLRREVERFRTTRRSTAGAARGGGTPCATSKAWWSAVCWRRTFYCKEPHVLSVNMPSQPFTQSSSCTESCMLQPVHHFFVLTGLCARVAWQNTLQANPPPA